MRYRWLWVLVIAGGLVGVACGSGGDGPASSNGAAGSTTEALVPGQAAPPDAVVLASGIIELPAGAFCWSCETTDGRGRLADRNTHCPAARRWIGPISPIGPEFLPAACWRTASACPWRRERWICSSRRRAR